jgi:WD40 repeat protein
LCAFNRHKLSNYLPSFSHHEYTELSLPLRSESGSKSSSKERVAPKFIIVICGLVTFGYFMSTINFSSPEANVINLNSSEANFKGIVELISAPEKVGEIIPNDNLRSYLAISKDDSLLAFTTIQGNIEVWDFKTKKRYAVLEYDKYISKLIFTSDGKYLLCETWDGEVIWDLVSKSIYGKIVETVQFVHATSDSESVVISNFSKVSIWSIKDLKNSYTFDLPESLTAVDDIVMTPDSKYIAVSAFGRDNNYDRIVKVFDMSTKKEIATLDTKIHHNLRISDDGKIVAVGDNYRKLVKVWNVETKELIADIKIDTSLFNQYLSPNGRFAYIIASEANFIYDLKDKTKIFRAEDSSFFGRFGTFTKNSKFLLYSEENIIKFLDLEKYEVVASLKYGDTV